ncbi:hypothetical protein HYPSUDRAFT_36356 [Hypholoma sublateritium FD-334 SS-4]|uniref:Uncharacterized protein n=1 Tax=Hypholoma sublateritium (strain FD-334 SS-4) TaxID=945553 RepID=A0A0D2PDM5_HYPSF|nr:hypothetical protein HYPSUDRAFT_36356 [Hypholoma sublateritium FD-334 SS-4]
MKYYFEHQNNFTWDSPPIIAPHPEISYIQEHVLAGQIPINNGVVFVEDNANDFTKAKDTFTLLMGGLTAQNTYPRCGTNTVRQQKGSNQTPSSPSYSLFADNELDVEYSGYGSAPASYDYGLSTSSALSATPSVHGFGSYEGSNEKSVMLPNHIGSPTFRIPPSYDCSFPSASESINTPDLTPYLTPNLTPDLITAPRAFEFRPDSISTRPTYSNTLSYTPSNADDISLKSTAYSSCLIGALGGFLFDEGKPTVDGTHVTQDPGSWLASQGVDAVAIEPADSENTENSTNPQQTCDEQSAWVINSFCEEGIEPYTNKFDHDTGAGPSTGSSVAAAMLDIGQARHGQSRDGETASAPAAQTERRSGKRKAVDELESPQAAKRLRVDPSAQSMGDIMPTTFAEEPAICLDNSFVRQAYLGFQIHLSARDTEWQ